MHAPLCQDLLEDTSIFAALFLQLPTLSIAMCFLTSTTNATGASLMTKKVGNVGPVIAWFVVCKLHG